MRAVAELLQTESRNKHNQAITIRIQAASVALSPLTMKLLKYMLNADQMTGGLRVCGRVCIMFSQVLEASAGNYVIGGCCGQHRRVRVPVTHAVAPAVTRVSLTRHQEAGVLIRHHNRRQRVQLRGNQVQQYARNAVD